MSKRRRNANSGGGCFTTLLNILTVIIVLGIVGVILVFFSIFTNPQANPIESLRPVFIPTIPPTLIPTETPIPLPATFTPGPSNTPRATPTLRPSSTPLPTDTPFSLVTPPTPDPNATATPVFPYVAQEGTPRYANYSDINPTVGCNGMFVLGQVFDINGAPQKGLIVELGGTLEGFTISQLTISGNQPNYGPAGYELPIINDLVASNKTLYIQLLNQTGAPVSDRIFFDTFDTCDKSMILINLLQTR